MIKGIQAIRGMNDCLPVEAELWQRIEAILRQVLYCYGYSEIRLPVVEKTSLFKRAIGEFTDVVEKEMYTFGDRNDESLTLRPEGTAGCVRAGIEHGLLYNNQEQRLWYTGPMFRYERPQKGRYRQFHQFGAEVFGLAGPDIDAELILLTVRCWKALGIDSHVRLELNSIGSPAARVQYRDVLIKFLQQHQDKLDEDCRRRMHVNPLRVLDSKNPHIQFLLNDAPLFSSCLDDESRQHFAQLRSLLDNARISYRVNEKLVRGLDYYNKTVFEWVTDNLGAQGTVCAGGRYDGLVEQLGGQATPAIGFAIGMERLALLAQTVNSGLMQPPTIDVYLIYSGEGTQQAVMKLAETLRDTFPHLKLMTHYGGGSIKKQFSRADKRSARLVLMSGENEITAGQIVVKDLHNGKQETLALCDLNAYLAMIFA